jgi:PAS domain S-box-containing protein
VSKPAQIKHLNCLLNLSHLVEEPGISLNEVLKGTVELLPAAWRYPEIAGACIVLGAQAFQTANYDAEAPWCQSADLIVHGRPRGEVRVCYLEERPQFAPDPFLSTERVLLGAVAERVGRIIERTQTQEELRWDRVILSTITDPISFVDRDYVYRFANETYARYARMSRQEIVGRTVAELLGKEAFHTLVKPQLDQCFEGQEVHYQAWFDVPDQAPKYMDVSYYPVHDERGAIVGAVASSRDITGLKRAEDALQRERDLVTRIMETSPVGIVVLDQEGRIAFANAQVQRVTGLSREQIVRLSYNDPMWRILDDDGQPLPDSQLPFPKVMRSGEPIQDLRQEVELPKGRKLLLSMNAAPLFDADGRIDGVVVSVNDITEQARLHEELQQYTAGLEQRVSERTAELEASQVALLQAERLAIVGKLASSLTHEISNPLQSVIGCLGLAEEARVEGQDVDEYLQIALTELRRVARIVARLRNLGRPPSVLVVKEPTDLDALLDQAVGLCRKKCQEQGIQIEHRVEGSLPLLELVPDQIEQVLLNLMLNAIDAMPDGGRLSIHISSSETPVGVWISFADTGAGIPADVLSHIFDPFYSTKPENLGLGLSICQDIVEAHGGHISGESQPGQGSRFTVWLPV